MEKKNKTSLSSFSICRKFREAVTANPAFHGIKQYFYHHREPRSVITPHANFETSLITTHLPENTQHDNNNIPIMFDYTSTPRTTTIMSHIGIISEREDKVANNVVETEPPRWKGQRDVGVPVQHSEQQVKRKSLDINDTFTDYIQRAKSRISRTVSNVSNGQNNSDPYHESNGTITINMEKNDNNQKDQFSDFIQHSKNKLITTSNIGSTTTTSFKRG